MGRYTTDNTSHFSVFFLKKYHHFKLGERAYNKNIIWSRNGEETGRINYDFLLDADNPRITLHYKSRNRGEEEWINMDYSVNLQSVVCNFGGKRWYFGCPTCNKRVAFLYSHNHYFICRGCADLTYDSCQEGKRLRGYPWKILSNDWKAEELLKTVKRTHYRGKPTKKFQRCLDLWNAEKYVTKEQIEALNRLL